MMQCSRVADLEYGVVSRINRIITGSKTVCLNISKTLMVKASRSRRDRNERLPFQKMLIGGEASMSLLWVAPGSHTYIV
jgi:hypothetical protein